jgi:hypothetical protein
VVIMIGATAISATIGAAAASLPFVVGTLCIAVALGRRPAAQAPVHQHLSYS